MHDATPAYGLRSLVILNSLVFVIFAFSFTMPKTSRDWRSFGAFSAFIVALFMFPVLVVVYARRAKSEERDMEADFGSEYARCRDRTPAFIPSFHRERSAS